MDRQTPSQIGSYELLRNIGNGAQGRVFLAKCVVSGHPSVKTDELVALKLYSDPVGDPDSPERIQRNVALLKKLAHPNIVRCIESFQWQGEWEEKTCVVFEYLEGETLQAIIERTGGELNWETIRDIFGQCIEALCHASHQGIVHRDIKPSNIFVCKDGTAKMIDFGIARFEESTSTSTQEWKGTLDYMAPDFVSFDGFRGDEKSDIFSLGVCFFRAVTGALPFPALGTNGHVEFTRRWKGHKPTISFRSAVFRVMNPEAREFIRRSVCSERGTRYKSFEDMKSAFRTIHRRAIKGEEREYELLSVLGKGGFGEVYKARRTDDGQLVAVKWLFWPHQSRRFIKEARLLERADHPHIVKYVDYIEMEGVGEHKTHFLVMELLEGIPEWTLRWRIKSSPSGLHVEDALKLFIHYLDALQYLHEHGVIHRDIKPGNLYAPECHHERAKIFDLGIARDLRGTVTTGHIPGTLEYMPPELTLPGKERGSPQSDIYSLGLSLYEALTGRRPFRTLPDNQAEAFKEFIRRSNSGGEPVNYDLSPFKTFPRLVDIVNKSIANDPEQRFADAKEMSEAIQGVIAQIQEDRTQAGVDAEQEPDATKATEYLRVYHTMPTPRRQATEPWPVQARPSVREASPEWQSARGITNEAGCDHTQWPGTDSRRVRTHIAAGSAVLLLAAIALLIRITSPAGHQDSAMKDMPPLAPRSVPSRNTLAPIPADEHSSTPIGNQNGAPRDDEKPQEIGHVPKSPIPSSAEPAGAIVIPDARPAQANGDSAITPIPDAYSPSQQTVQSEVAVGPAVTAEITPTRTARENASVVVPSESRAPVGSARPGPGSNPAPPPVAPAGKPSMSIAKPNVDHIALAEAAVADYLTWMYQVKDPVLGTYRRFREAAPDTAGPLSVLPGPAPGAGLQEMARHARLTTWKDAGALQSDADRSRLASRLDECAVRLDRTCGSEALICRTESIILRTPANRALKVVDGHAVGIQSRAKNAHAVYAPQASSLDSLDSLAEYAGAGGRIDSYDIRVALYSACYTWRNAIEGECDYAADVSRSLGTILVRASHELAAETVASLGKAVLKEEEGGDSDDSLELYIIEALSFMPDLPADSSMRQEARKWLEAYGSSKHVKFRRDSTPKSLALLKSLLKVSR